MDKKSSKPPYMCNIIQLDESQKVLKQLYHLILTYANIYELYMEKQLLSFGKFSELESPEKWLSEFDSMGEFQNLCVGKTSSKNLSQNVIRSLLKYGYKTLRKQGKRIRKDAPWKERHLLHQYLYNDEIWYRYALNRPYMQISASFEIEKQLFSKGQLRIPKYGYVCVNHQDLKNFPIHCIPVAARLYVEENSYGKLRGYVKIASEEMECSDGFVMLKRRK